MLRRHCLCLSLGYGQLACRVCGQFSRVTLVANRAAGEQVEAYQVLDDVKPDALLPLDDLHTASVMRSQLQRGEKPVPAPGSQVRIQIHSVYPSTSARPCRA